MRAFPGLFAVGSESNGCCFRPCAPGYRNNPSGALGGVGNNGYSWASSVSGINGMNLWFNTTGLNPSNTNNRANGLQVRCLQVFTGTLFLIDDCPGKGHTIRRTEQGSGVPAANGCRQSE